MTGHPRPGEGLWRAFREAGFTPDEIKAVAAGKKKVELREFRAKLFPKVAAGPDLASSILVQKIEEVCTFGALEDLGKEGFGTVHARFINRCVDNAIEYVGELAALKEREARRIFGRPSSKIYRAVEALLAKHNLYFGMDLPDHVQDQN